MKNYQETMEISESFYADCVKYWEKQNPKIAKVHALQDIYNIKHNPYNPTPEWIDMSAKIDFIDKVISDLNL